MLDTEGVNILVVMFHGDVDATKTTRNHLIEVIEVFGIENLFQRELVAQIMMGPT